MSDQSPEFDHLCQREDPTETCLTLGVGRDRACAHCLVVGWGETPLPGFRFKGDELQERIRAVLPDDCWVTRSTDMRCTTFVGGTFGKHRAEWVVEMCCLPCRIRAAVDALYPPAGGAE